MLETLVESEGEPDLVQISGGEPTIHPQILEILKLAKSKPIRHIMLNTNGVRIARDKDFVAALAELKPGFEVYLQFDSLERGALENLRGADLRRVRERCARQSRARRHFHHARLRRQEGRQRRRDRRASSATRSTIPACAA